MSIFSWGDEVKKAGEGVGIVGDALDSLFTSDEERLSKAEAIERLKAEPHKVMGKLALLDAASRNAFQAGWRPFIGWIAGFALAAYFIPQFLVGGYMFVDAYISTGSIIPYPVKPDALMELVWLLLGLGAYRTGEKLAGVAT
jgi:hypothetical protein